MSSTMYHGFDVYQMNGSSRSPFSSTDNLCTYSVDMHGNALNDKYSHSSTPYDHENQCSNRSPISRNVAATMSADVAFDPNMVDNQMTNSIEWLVKVPIVSANGNTNTREYTTRSKFSPTTRPFNTRTMNRTSSVPILHHAASEHNKSTNTLDALGYGSTPTTNVSFLSGPPIMMAQHNIGGIPYAVTSCTTGSNNNSSSSHMMAHQSLLGNSHMSEIPANMQMVSHNGNGTVANPTLLSSTLNDLADVSTDDQVDLQFIQRTSYRIRMLPPPLPLHVHKEIWYRNEYGDDYAATEMNSSAARKFNDVHASSPKDVHISTAAPSMWHANTENGYGTDMKRNGHDDSDKISGAEREKNDCNGILHTDANTMTRDSESDVMVHSPKSLNQLDATLVSAQREERTIDKEERLAAYRLIMLRWYRHVRVLESKPEVRQRITRTHTMCPTLEETRQRLLSEANHKNTANADIKNALEEQILSMWSDDCMTWWRGTFKPRTRNARTTDNRTEETDIPNKQDAVYNSTNTTNHSASSDDAQTPSYVDGSSTSLCKTENASMTFQSRLPHVQSSTTSLFNLTNEIVDEEDQIAWSFTHDLLKTIDDE